MLIQGESGTGKELVAHGIHNASSRKNNRFVEINCAGLAENLLEAELFGYEKGAFTGAATSGKMGLFEAANGGSIFLDEIGEMSVHLQAKLLRVLQEKRFTRVAGIENVEVDVRVIASTNRDLQKEVKEGNFREDLLYRLNVVPIHLSPLRERKEDVPVLAKYFVDRFNQELGRNIQRIHPEAEQKLMRYDWPGNVRELRNVIERATILSDGDELHPDGLLLAQEVAEADPDPEPEGTGCGLLLTEDRSIASMEKALIAKVLEETMWRRMEAAKILGINRTTLYKKIKEYDLEPKVRTAMAG